MRIVLASVAFGVFFVSLASNGYAEEPIAKSAPATKPAPTTPPKKSAPRSDSSVGAALARSDDRVALQVNDNASPAPPASPTASIVTQVPSSGGLASIRVTTKQASDKAGDARDLTVSAEGTKPSRPVATVRTQRRMHIERTMAALSGAFDACRTQGAAVGATGTVAIALDVDPQGSVERASVANASAGMPKQVATCIAAAFMSAKFGAPGVQGALVTIPVTVAPDRGDATRLPPTE